MPTDTACLSTKPTTTLHPRLLLAILATLSAFGPVATDMYLSGFSLIKEYFQTSMGMVSISLSVFFFGLAAGQLFYGPLIDRFGRKPLLLLGVSLFSISSLLLALAPSIESFIALRLVQAIGSCAGMVVARAMISDLYKEKEAARFFSLMMAVAIIAPILAPAIGGYLIALAGWKSVFVFAAVFGFLTLGITHFFLPETLPHDHKKSADLREILISYGRLFLRKHFILPTLVCAIGSGEMFAFISGSPYVYITLHGVSQEHYGLLFGGNALGMIVSAKINHTALKHFAPIKILWTCVIANLFFSTLLFCLAQSVQLPVLFVLILLSLITVPAIGANATALAMDASGDRRGSASALIGLLQFGLASVSSALVGALHNETAYPMTGMILGCSAIAVGILVADRFVVHVKAKRRR
ncbi:MAG: multidrug effflux MFS transporter [Bdellovibrionales bacterium]